MNTLHRIIGTSMEPHYKNGHFCIVQDIDHTDFYEGSVVCFERFGQNVIHRLIIVRGNKGRKIIVEKGDNYPIASVINTSMIRGVAVNYLVDEKKKLVKIGLQYELIRFSVFLWKMFFQNKVQKRSTLLRRIFWEYIFLWVVPTIFVNHIKYVKKNLILLKKQYPQYTRLKRMERLI